jgi:hypothetical protein
MRTWRQSHPLTGEARKRQNARAYLKVYIRRGKVKRQPCEVCGRKAEAHHTDYSKPLEVRWLCTRHHRELHRATCGAVPSPEIPATPASP